MGVKLNTASGGSVSIEPTNTASNFTLTVPAQTGTVVASDASGNVGIGTSSPPLKLSVLSGVATDSTSTPVLMLGSDRTDRYASINSVRGVASTYLGLAFSTSNNASPAEVMRISPDGNVGIGTSSPSANARVTIAGVTGSGNGGGLLITGSGYQTNPPGLLLGQYSSTVGYIQAPAGGQIEIWDDATNGIARFLDNGNFQFNSGYGSVATAYGCRAWVNFNGTGTVAIRGSGNVSSVTDFGTGNYGVNYSTAMPDTNYSIIGMGTNALNAGSQPNIAAPSNNGTPVDYSTGSTRLYVNSSTDSTVVAIAVFR